MQRGRFTEIFLIFAVTSGAWSTTAAADSGPPAYSRPEHRQFDFWLGDWEVHAEGRIAGRNRIESALGGCAIIERLGGGPGERRPQPQFLLHRRRPLAPGLPALAGACDGGASWNEAFDGTYLRKETP